MKTRKHLWKWLIMLLFLASVSLAMADNSPNQNVCINTIHTYTVDLPSGTPGSTYAWTLTGGGTFQTADGTYTIDVLWTTVGTFNLQVIQTHNGCPALPVVVHVTVNPNANAGVISGTSPLCINATATYTSNGDAGGTWTSTNPIVASVDPVSGLVTALSAGTSDITYTVTGCGTNLTAFKTLTVTPDANAGSISGTSPLCIGAIATYLTSGDLGGTWSSSNPAVATIDAITGVVNALSAGTTTITYAVTGCGSNLTTTLILTVNPNANPGIISGTTPLCIGATAIYTTDGDAGGVWSSSDITIATVDPVSGLVTAVGSGFANIVYTVTGCGSNLSSSKQVSVAPAANAGIVSGLSPLCVGTSAQYTTTGDLGGIWSSSDITVATVDPATGMVTAVAPGTITIIYTVTGCGGANASANQSLTVNPIPVTSAINHD